MPPAQSPYGVTHMPLSALHRFSFLHTSLSLQSASVTGEHWVPFVVQSPYFLQFSVVLHLSPVGATAVDAADAVEVADPEDVSEEAPLQQPETNTRKGTARTKKRLTILGLSAQTDENGK